MAVASRVGAQGGHCPQVSAPPVGGGEGLDAVGEGRQELVLPGAALLGGQSCGSAGAGYGGSGHGVSPSSGSGPGSVTPRKSQQTYPPKWAPGAAPQTLCWSAGCGLLASTPIAWGLKVARARWLPESSARTSFFRCPLRMCAEQHVRPRSSTGQGLVLSGVCDPRRTMVSYRTRRKTDWRGRGGAVEGGR
jgi:hypothetical protein